MKKLATILPTVLIKRAEEWDDYSVLDASVIPAGGYLADLGSQKLINPKFKPGQSKELTDLSRRIVANSSKDNALGIKRDIDFVADNHHPRKLADIAVGNRSKGMRQAGIMGYLLSGIPNAVTAFSDSEETGRNSAIVGTGLSAVPLTTDAIQAAKKFNLMRSLGGSKKTAMGALAKIPMGIFNAALPALTYKWKQNQGGYDKGQ